MHYQRVQRVVKECLIKSTLKFLCTLSALPQLNYSSTFLLNNQLVAAKKPAEISRVIITVTKWTGIGWIFTKASYWEDISLRSMYCTRSHLVLKYEPNAMILSKIKINRMIATIWAAIFFLIKERVRALTNIKAVPTSKNNETNSKTP